MAELFSIVKQWIEIWIFSGIFSDLVFYYISNQITFNNIYLYLLVQININNSIYIKKITFL